MEGSEGRLDFWDCVTRKGGCEAGNSRKEELKALGARSWLVILSMLASVSQPWVSGSLDHICWQLHVHLWHQRGKGCLPALVWNILVKDSDDPALRPLPTHSLDHYLPTPWTASCDCVCACAHASSCHDGLSPGQDCTLKARGGGVSYQKKAEGEVLHRSRHEESTPSPRPPFPFNPSLLPHHPILSLSSIPHLSEWLHPVAEARSLESSPPWNDLSSPRTLPMNSSHFYAFLPIPLPCPSTDCTILCQCDHDNGSSFSLLCLPLY